MPWPRALGRAEQTGPQIPRSCPSERRVDGNRAPSTSLPKIYWGNRAPVLLSPWCRSQLMANSAGED